MKISLAIASLALVAGTMTGCSGDAPTDASKDDFCQTFEDMQKEMSAVDEDAESSELVKTLKKLGSTMEDVGTPEDIPEDARKGFELFVGTIKDLPDDATEKELDEVDKDFSDAENKQFEEFQTYVGKTCADFGGEE